MSCKRPNAKSNLKKGLLTFTLELKSQSSLLMGEIAFLNQLHQTQAGQKLYSYNVHINCTHTYNYEMIGNKIIQCFYNG